MPKFNKSMPLSTGYKLLPTKIVDYYDKNITRHPVLLFPGSDLCFLVRVEAESEKYFATLEYKYRLLRYNENEAKYVNTDKEDHWELFPLDNNKFIVGGVICFSFLNPSGEYLLQINISKYDIGKIHCEDWIDVASFTLLNEAKFRLNLLLASIAFAGVIVGVLIGWLLKCL